VRLLVTGASGLVGSALSRAAADAGHTVAGVVGRWSGSVPGAAELRSCDLADPAAASRLLAEFRPDAVVNAAAVAEPALCEADPVRSAALNTDWPGALAAATAAAGTRLVHLSTEQVFAGETPPFGPASEPAPLNRYGRQKLAGERAVRAADPAAAVVRLPLLFGNSLGGRRSVHEKVFETWAAGREMPLFTDEVRMVCTADSVAALLLALVPRRDLAGVLHWAGAEAVSRWEMGRALCAHFGVPERWIRAQRRAEAPQVTATRPRDLTLDCAGIDTALGVRRETLADAVRTLRRPSWAAAVGRE
jgi:dTDP-4-dehydrorhamnose reductase